MSSLSENMRVIMDRIEQLNETLLAVPGELYEAVDNLEPGAIGTETSGDYLLCFEDSETPTKDVLTEWSENNEGMSLVDSGNNWAIFKKL